MEYVISRGARLSLHGPVLPLFSQIAIPKYSKAIVSVTNASSKATGPAGSHAPHAWRCIAGLFITEDFNPEAVSPS